MNILLSCVGRRTYLVEYFRHELQGKGLIYGADESSFAPALKNCDKSFIVPSVHSNNYIDKLLNICKDNKINIIVSLNDLELPILARNKKLFLANGVNVIISDIEIIEICNDKWKTFQFVKSIGIPTPNSFLNPIKAIQSIKQKESCFPLIVKPRLGSASFGLKVVNDVVELHSAFESCKYLISKSYLASFFQRKDTVIIQSFIKGYEYGVDIFNDLSGNYHGSICKKKISMRAGETDKATTIYNKKLAEYAKKIALNLKHIGNLDCDFLENENGFFLLELNARFGGGYPFSHLAGGNLVKALLQSILGQNEQIDIKYEAGKSFAKFDNIQEC